MDSDIIIEATNENDIKNFLDKNQSENEEINEEGTNPPQ